MRGGVFFGQLEMFLVTHDYQSLVLAVEALGVGLLNLPMVRLCRNATFSTLEPLPPPHYHMPPTLRTLRLGRCHTLTLCRWLLAVIAGCGVHFLGQGVCGLSLREMMHAHLNGPAFVTFLRGCIAQTNPQADISRLRWPLRSLR
jgi:hypothetical protein